MGLTLVGGPFDGRVVRVDTNPYLTLVLPGYEDCGHLGCLHFPEHRYAADGRWLSSETYVNWRWNNPWGEGHIPSRDYRDGMI